MSQVVVTNISGWSPLTDNKAKDVVQTDPVTFPAPTATTGEATSPAGTKAGTDQTVMSTAQTCRQDSDSDSKALLGIGLGLGIPLLIALLIIGWMILKLRRAEHPTHTPDVKREQDDLHTEWHADTQELHAKPMVSELQNSEMRLEAPTTGSLRR